MKNFYGYFLIALLTCSCASQNVAIKEMGTALNAKSVKDLPYQIPNELIAHFPLDGTNQNLAEHTYGERKLGSFSSNYVYKGVGSISTGGSTLTTDRENNPDSALELDGKYGVIKIGYHKSIHFNSAYSVSMWIYYPGDHQRSCIISREIVEPPFGVGALFINAYLQEHDRINKHQLSLTSQDFKNTSRFQDFELKEGWHHIVLIDNMNVETSVYVDGELIGSYPDKNRKRDPHSMGWYIIGNIKYGFNTKENFHFKGKVDDIRFYSGVLDQQAINKLYTE